MSTTTIPASFEGRPMPSAYPLLLAAAVAAFLLSALLAVLFNSLSVLITVLGISFIPLMGVLYPTFVLTVFLFFDLLFPKLPLIQIQGYMVPIRIEDVFLACALVCLLLRYLIYRERPAPNPLQRWMLLFCLATGTSLLFGLLVLGSVPSAKIGFLFWLRTPEYFAACYLCLLGVRNWSQYRQIVIALAAFVFLIGAYSMLQEYGLVPIFNAMHLTDEIVVIQFFSGFGQDRLFSTFAGPYDLAAFYLLAIPILVALFIATASRWLQVLLGALLALSLLCLYLTYARAPLVALVAVLVAALWLFGKRTLALVVGPVCVLPALLFSGFVERLSYAAADPFAYNSLGGRMQNSWSDALAAAARSPLFGTGPASLAEGMGVDGMYFMLLGMWGLLGLACFLILLGKAIHCQRECMRTSSHPMQRALAIGLLAGSIGLLINAVSVDSFFVSKVAFAYWFLMGLLFAGHRLEQRERAWRPAAPALAALGS